jgi:hypothetical protein
MKIMLGLLFSFSTPNNRPENDADTAPAPTAFKKTRRE